MTNDQRLPYRCSADLQAGARIRLGRKVLRDGAADLFFGRRFCARALGVAHGVHGAAAEIAADQVFDEDRQELAAAERRVRLAHRVAGGGPHLTLLLESIETAAGRVPAEWSGNGFEKQAGEQ